MWQELTSSAIDAAYVRGWEFSCKMRLRASSTPSSIIMQFANGATLLSNRYEVELSISGNDVAVRDSWSGITYLCHGAMDGDHHLFCMRALPLSQTVTFLYDGTPVGSVSSNFPSSNLLAQGVMFGAQALGSGRARYNRVEFRYLDDLGSNYCDPAVPNSTGSPAEIDAVGSAYAAHNDLVSTASALPPNRFGYLLASLDADFVAGPGASQGNLCLGGNLARFVAQGQSSGAAGSFSIRVNLGAIPSNPSTAVVAGETWNFQCWYRDQSPTSTSNFTGGARITFR